MAHYSIGQHLFGTHNASIPNQKANLRITTSAYGVAIPIIYGRARVGANLIEMPAAPTATETTTTQRAGKGGGIKTTSYSYKAAVAMALCEGPIVGIVTGWSNKNKLSWTDLQNAGFSLFTGTSAQSAWSYLSTNYASRAVPYQYTAYLANATMDLPDDQVPSFSFEIDGLLQYNAAGGIFDANPKDILTDFLTEANHGLGFPASLIGDLTSYSQYCLAMDLLLSPVYDQQKAARDHIDELMTATYSGVVWSDGVLKVVPYGDTSVTGNGTTYTPNTTPLYDLTDDDFLPPGPGEDPITVTRKPAADAYNQVQVEFEDRDGTGALNSGAGEYNTSIAEAKDQAAIDASGLRTAPVMTLHLIRTAARARVVAQLQLQRQQAVRNAYVFRLGWRYSLLEPMDLVTLTDVGLGLSKTPVRITQVEELDNDDGIEVTAEDWPFGHASATRYGTQAGNGTSPNVNVAPGNTATPVIFEGPAALQSAPLEIWIGASGGQYWGGCDVYVSTDNLNFVRVGSISTKANYGVLTAALATNAAYPSTDTTHTLAVDLTTSGGALGSYSGTDFGNLVPLCYCDGEFLAFENASLSSAYHYNLTTLYRGLYGSTIPASHAIGASFLLCDTSIFRLAYPQGRQGQTLYFKFPAFNIYGQQLQDLSTVTSVSHVIGRSPSSPSGGSTNNQFSGLSIDSENDSLDQVTFHWTWGGDASATFRVFSAESGSSSAPASSDYSPAPGTLAAGTTSYVFQSAWDLNSAGTHSDVIGFYVVAYVGGVAVGTSATTTLLVHRT